MYVSEGEDLRSSIAWHKNFLISSSAGTGMVIFDTHNFPRTPESFFEIFCCTRILCELGDVRYERMKVTISSVRRSNFEDAGERERVCQNAVLARLGI